MAKFDGAIGKVEAPAKKLIESPPEGEELVTKQEAIEKSAEEAMKQFEEIRKDITDKLAAARQYAPEAKKEATAELTQCQSKLTESQKKLGAYKNFKKKIDAGAAAAAKATGMVKDISKGQMTVEEV